MMRLLNKIFFIILFLFFICCLDAKAQKQGKERVDSIFAALPDVPEDTMKVRILAYLSRNMNVYDLNKGVELGMEAVKLAEKLQFEKGIGISKLSLALIYFYQSKWDLVIENCLEAERILKKYNDRDRLCHAYCILSVTYKEIDFELGKRYYNMAKSMFWESKEKQWQQFNQSWISDISDDFEPDSAEVIGKDYEKSLTNSTDHQRIKNAYKAGHSLSQNNYDSALYYCNKTLAIILASGDKRNISSIYIALGRIYAQLEKRDSTDKKIRGKAEECFMKSIDAAEEYGSLLSIYRGYYELYQIQKSYGKTEEALNSLEKYEENYQKVQEVSNAGKLGAIAYKYDIELKEKDIEILEAQNLKRLLIIIGISALLLLIVTTIILIMRLWRKNQLLERQETDNLMVTLEQKALQSMMNPHFIFNSLGSIQNYLLQNKPGEAGLYLSQFARLIRQNISGIHSAMINLEEEIDRLKNYMDLERLRMENKFIYQFHLDENLEEDMVMIPAMIIQPFVENAILHGVSALEKDGLISISFAMASEKTIKITVEDNGIGIKQSKVYNANNQTHLHLSMEMTRKRIDIFGKKYKVETSLEISELSPGNVNPGTRVEIVLPVSTTPLPLL